MDTSVTSSLDFQKYAMAELLCPDASVIRLQIFPSTSWAFAPNAPPLSNTIMFESGYYVSFCKRQYISAFFNAFSRSPAACSGTAAELLQYVIAADVTMLKSSATLPPSLPGSLSETSMSKRSAASCFVGLRSETSEIGGADVVWMCACLARSSTIAG